MTETESFYCVPCRLNFDFKSRYERHFKTLSHQRYALCVAEKDEPSAFLFDQEMHSGLKIGVM